MNTMEITKIVGALCGSLLVLLLIQAAGSTIYSVDSDVVAYEIDLGEDEADGDVAEEAEPEQDIATLVASADPAAGERVFRRCSACHQVEDGANGVGPHLYSVVGRDIGAVDGFNYSDTLAGLDGAWTAENISGFIENPSEWAPGTSMGYAGLGDIEDRAAVIAYLQSIGGE